MRRIILLALSILFAAVLLMTGFKIPSRAAEEPFSVFPPIMKSTQEAPSVGVAERIQPALAKRLSTSSPSDQIAVVIQWKTPPFEQVVTTHLPTGQPQTAFARSQRRAQVLQLLQENAARQSASLQARLETAIQQGQASQVKVYWVTPIISAHASPALIQSLSQRDDVVQIRIDEAIPLPPIEFRPTRSPLSLVPLSPALPWDLELMKVDLAQQALHLDGTGVVVANIDTGVDWQHPALMTRYRGYNPKGPANHAGNWYVVTGEPFLYPYDSYGHGTHTMGTMVGEDGAVNRIGVAPGARWIAVKLFNNQGYTFESWIHAAFQWILAPDGNPALAPDIVNNSWGSDISSDDRYRPDIAALLAASILPVFSAGNSGPYPASVGSPASYPESLAVGAIDQEKLVAGFSGRGPSPWQDIKPDIVAPGTNIRSSFPGGGYAYGSGTSMAAPHVAGLAALLLQVDPALSPAQLRSILTSTAEPLGAVIPNNDSGWGLVNAYAAGLMVSPNGVLSGMVTSQEGGFVAYPGLSATLLSNPTQAVTITGAADGTFALALLPGQYDVSAWGFGFERATLHAVPLLTGTVTSRNFNLQPEPSGLLTGTVLDLDSLAPLSATLTISGTRLKTQTNLATGIYTFILPVGEWRVQALAERHKLAHSTVVISPGVSTQLNFSLPSTPHILLVDGGRWYYGSQIEYLTDALTALDLPYTLWPIRSLGVADTPDERPIAGSFNGYDVVIWADPDASPGWINATPAISDYLTHSNGHLLLTGQDILFLDGGGSIFNYPYLSAYLGASFDHEEEPATLTGVPEGIFDSFSLDLNTPDSAQQQINPDAAKITDPLHSQPVLAWPSGSPGAVTSGTCRAYRLAWLGFGLEGAGPRLDRIHTLDAVLNWFQAPLDPYGLVVKYNQAPLIGVPSQTLTQTVRLISTGAATDILTVTVQGGPWPIDLALPDGSHFSTQAQIPLPSCQTVVITATTTIPASAPSHTFSIHTLDISSPNDPALDQTITLTFKTPAPILIVDHQRFYHQIEAYHQALDGLGLSYDVFNAYDLIKLPTDKTLSAYPLVIWTTGYNWYDPLGRDSSSQNALTSYLDSGGRLLVTGQDILDVSGNTNLIRHLGVAGSLLTITTTEVAAAPGGPFGQDYGPWSLQYIYKNWSDGFGLVPGAVPLLRDQNLHTVGALFFENNLWRTAFFSFPLETLAADAFQTILADTTLWLSPFGESSLSVPTTVESGGEFPLQLLLHLAYFEPLSGLQARLHLPAGASLVPGSLQGPWAYDPDQNALLWQGNLSPDQTLTLTARLKADPGLLSGSRLPFQARLSMPAGLTIVSQAAVLIDAPWLEIDVRAAPRTLHFGDTSYFTVTLSNTGQVSAASLLTATLPNGLSLLTETLTVTQGSITVQANHILWTNLLTAGEEVSLSYSGQVTTQKTGTHLNTRYDLVGATTHRLSWLELIVPMKLYFPFVGAWKPVP